LFSLDEARGDDDLSLSTIYEIWPKMSEFLIEIMVI